MTTSSKGELALYLEEYKIRHQESMQAVDSFNGQSKYVQAFFTVLFVVTAYLLNWISSNNILLVKDYTVGVIIIFLILPAIYSYLDALLLVALCNCLLARYRMAALEIKMNRLTGIDAPYWESHIIQNFQSSKCISSEGYFNPNWWLGVWVGIGSFLIHTLLIILFFSIFRNATGVYSMFPFVFIGYIVLILGASIFIHFYLLGKGAEAIKHIMFKLSNVKET